MRLEKFTCNGKHKSFEERKECPICSRKQALFGVSTKFNKDNILGSSPSVFVGSHNYPNVRLGFMSLPEHDDSASDYDNPRKWGNESFSNAKILGLRSSLVYSHFVAGNGESSRQVDLLKDVAMAKDYVDLDIKFLQKPQIKFEFDSINTTMGPRAKLEKVKEASNPKIPLHVDKVNSHDDMMAVDAVSYLSKHNYDENYVSRLLSVGVLGARENRKIVPTRWSITATDDMVANNNLDKIRDFKQSSIKSYFGGYMGNYYLITFLSGKWSYELFECYVPRDKDESLIYSTDHEYFYGRKNYAANTAGGYYSVRLAITEKMLKEKEQASVFVLRIITPEYKVPLGVWVTREAARKSLSSRPIEFGDISLLKNYIELLVRKKFGMDVKRILNESKLLNVKQTTLSEF